jgi:putative FmdB family regulatory protein
MPIYEYLCEACGRLTEVMQKVTDRPPGKCPECGSKKMAKVVSRTSFQLKGGGWYSDLYSKPKEKKKAEEKSSSAPAPEKSGSAKPATEKKAAPKKKGD